MLDDANCPNCPTGPRAQADEGGDVVYRYCPNCESRNAVIYERGEGESFCLDCAFTWWQSENFITVSRKVLEQLAGLRAVRETTDR